MLASQPHLSLRHPKGALFGGALLAAVGLSGMAGLIALMIIKDARAAHMEIAIGLAPAALLSLVFQLALLAGCRLLFLARRGSGRTPRS